MKTIHDSDLQVGDQFVHVDGEIPYEVLFREGFADGTANVVARQQPEDTDCDLVVFAFRAAHPRLSGHIVPDTWRLLGTGLTKAQLGKSMALLPPRSVPIQVVHDTTPSALQASVAANLPFPVWLGHHHNQSYVKHMLRNSGSDERHAFWDKSWTTFHTECVNVQALMDRFASLAGVIQVTTTMAMLAKLDYFKWRDSK